MRSYICIDGQITELASEQVLAITNLLPTQSVELSSVAIGDTVKIGPHEMVVLEQHGEATSLIKKGLLSECRFGTRNNYNGSYADERCNRFASEIADAVGVDNMILFTVDLTSNDGLKDYGIVDRRVSLLTADQYRRYVAVLDMHKPDGWWWLATPFSTPTHLNHRNVLCVSPSGFIDYGGYDDYDCGVRPFCILKSNIFVSK